MKQLVEVPLTIHQIRSLARKKKGSAKEDKGVVVTLGANLSGAKLIQFFPTKALFTKLADVLWKSTEDDDDGEVNLKVGAMPLDYEIVGGRVAFASSLFGTTLLEFELADIKGVRITPEEGRVCRVHVVAVLKPGTGDVEKLYDALKSEVLFSARQAPTDKARAEAGGQRSMPLPPADGEAKDPVDEDRAPTQEEAEKQVAAAMGVNGTAPDGVPLVPGRKPPQRPKRQGLPATAGSH